MQKPEIGTIRKGKQKWNRPNDLGWIAYRFGLRPSFYRKDERVKALLALKGRLDIAISEARAAAGGKFDYKAAQKKQANSKTKDALLQSIPEKFGLTEKDMQYEPLNWLVRGIADSQIYLALLMRPTKPKARAKLPSGVIPSSTA